jgi:hypothetical protein
VYTRDLEVVEVRGIVQDDKVPQGRQGRGPAGDGRVPEAEQGGSGFVRKHEKSFSRKKKRCFIDRVRALLRGTPIHPKNVQ